ncbi:MAG: acyltransferase family protein [Pseudomonas sp.]|nr:acyltransferase family protein [Pseudomonas sp.]
MSNAVNSPAAQRVSETARIPWIDAAKGLGILLIFFGHVFSVAKPTPLYVYVYAFHVPLFFFLSGLTLKPDAESLGRVLTKKLRTLVVPYLYYAFLGYLFYLVGYLMAQRLNLHIAQFDYGLWPPLWGILYGSIGDGNLVNGPLWFVMALFCCFMLGWVINRYVASLALRLLLVALLAAAGIGLAPVYRLPWSLSPALVALVFFQAGYLYQNSSFFKTLKPGTQWGLLGLALLTSLFSQLNGFVTLAETRIGQPLLYFFFAFAGIAMLVLALQRLGEHGRWLAWLGQYSLSIMLIHMLIIKSAKVGLAGLLAQSVSAVEESWTLGLIVLGLSAVLLVPAVWFMERFLPFTLGKRGKRAGS